jgi:hypothetical protein
MDFRLSPRLYGPAAAVGRNSCTHTDEQVAPVASTILEFGWANSLRQAQMTNSSPGMLGCPADAPGFGSPRIW